MPDEVILGCDIGGTFTDFFLIAGTETGVLKAASTPAAPQQAVLEGLGRLPHAVQRLVHGSTIATNAVLERKGARTALITTAGFRDVIEIGRQARPRIYELEPSRPPPLVPRDLRFEVRERVLGGGRIETPLDAREARAAIKRAIEAGAESLAVSLLFSFLRPEHERLLEGEARRAGLPVSSSHVVLPEYREYERTATTVINAYVRPVMGKYLDSLAEGIRRLGVSDLEVMSSSGGLLPSDEAARLAAGTVLSGPAGGVAGAFYSAVSAGFDRIISLDMGGTSTDVALCDGELTLQTEASVAGIPVRLPAVDVHTVGAGGGSIVWVDAAGSLQVGPQSAGADPGPAAYGRGGPATITDAHAVVGHLPAPLAGSLELDRPAAVASLSHVKGFAGPEEAATAALRVVEATMERALRVVSLERGHDPRDFTLVAFGGAGPLHACRLAGSLGIRRVLVPRHPGVLSAVGMALAPRRRELSRSVLAPLLLPGADEAIRSAAGLLEAAAAGLPGERQWFADVRFRGQAYELRILLSEPTPRAAVLGLEEAHRRRYGFLPSGDPELVNLRLAVVGARRALPVAAAQTPAQAGTPGQTSVFDRGRWVEVPWLRREEMYPDQEVTGPALITQYDCTTLVDDGWRAWVEATGDLLLEPGR